MPKKQVDLDGQLWLRLREPLSATQLAERLGRKLNSVQGALRRLEEQGMVKQIGVDGNAKIWHRVNGRRTESQR